MTLLTDIQVREGKFQGPLILKTFSYHLKRTGKLALEFRDTPDGALALTAAAVGRVSLLHCVHNLFDILG